MTSSSLHPNSNLLHPDSARRSPSPALSRTVSGASTPASGRSSPALSRTVSGASSAPSLTRDKSYQIPSFPRSKSSSRLSLKYQAQTWRFLEGIGVYLNSWPNPIPPHPTFTRHFPTSDIPASYLELAFYVPKDYAEKKKRGHKYPVVVNFHGGGFTLGTTHDDARWAAFVLQETPAIFVSVEYRLAPEHPFPIAVEDGVEALLHLAVNSSDYGIDATQMAISGFSAGANLAFAVPLRLYDHLQTIKNDLPEDSVEDLALQRPLPNIVSIISFYPALDMRLSRAERRARCCRPDKTLPPILTDLFDESYLPDETAKVSPYASPPVASDETLIKALPKRIAFYLCEWDMLLQEGKDFAQQLKELGKDVDCSVAKEKRHAFDKAPYPFGVDPKVGEMYLVASGVLREAFRVHSS